MINPGFPINESSLQPLHHDFFLCQMVLYYSLPSFTFSKQDTSTSSSNNKTYLPKASTSCNITPPMCKSPRTRSVFSTCKSVTETFRSHEPSTIWPSLIILKFGVCTSIIEDTLSTNMCVFAGCVFQCHCVQPTLHSSRAGVVGYVRRLSDGVGPTAECMTAVEMETSTAGEVERITPAIISSCTFALRKTTISSGN